MDNISRQLFKVTFLEIEMTIKGVGSQWEVDTRVGYPVDLQLGQVHVKDIVKDLY